MNKFNNFYVLIFKCSNFSVLAQNTVIKSLSKTKGLAL